MSVVFKNSLFFSDYLRVKRYAPSNKHLAGSSAKQLSPFQERAASKQQCEFVCNKTITGGGGDIQFIGNETTQLVGVVNITASVGIIIDISNSLVVLLNGTTGALVVVNITSQTGIYIAAGLTTKGWISANISFENYFKSLTSLVFLFNLNVGVTFTLSNVSNAVLQVIANLLISLSASIAIRLQGSVTAALTILIEISSTIIVLFRGSLKGLLIFAGAGAFKIYGDLVLLVAVLKGIAVFFGKISGGLAYLIQQDVKFKLSLLLAAANGIELLINLLLAIVVSIDLSVILGSALGSVEGLLSLIVQLGGNASIGVTGVIRVVYGIVAYINGNVNLLTAIGFLFEFAANRNISGTGKIDISIYFSALLEVITIQNSTYPGSTGLAGFETIIVQLIKGTLVVGGVNISAIIEILIALSIGAVNLIVRVLLSLKAVISIGVSIATLILYILISLTTSAGTVLVGLVFGISFSLSQLGNGVASVLYKALTGAFNIVTIASLLLGGIDGVLKSIPVVGTIYASLSAALSAESNGSVSISVVLSASSSASVVTQIISFIRSVFSGSFSLSVSSG